MSLVYEPVFNPNDFSTTTSTGTTKPGGSNTYVQYNKNGSFGGDATFYFNRTTKALYATSLVLSSDLTVAGEVFLSNLLSSTTDKMLYYDESTHSISYGNVTSATPAGSDTQVQFNDGGSFGTDDTFYYAKSENRLYTQYLYVGDEMSVSDVLATKSSGRVGINQSDPQYALDVSGDINYTGSLRENGVAKTFLSIGGSNGQIQYNSSGSLAGSSDLTFGSRALTAYNMTISNQLSLSSLSNTSTDYLLRYNPTSKVVSYSTLGVGGNDNSVQYKSGNNLSGDSAFTYDNGFLNIYKSGAQIRAQDPTGTQKSDLTTDGLNITDGDDNTLSQLNYEKLQTPKIYETDSANPTNAVQYKKDDNQITGDELLTWSNEQETLYAPNITSTGTIQCSSILIAGSYSGASTSNGTLPVGGNQYDMLMKTSSNNYDSAWVTVVPSGGTTGQVLSKKSSTNFDTEWSTVSSGSSVSGQQALFYTTSDQTFATGGNENLVIHWSSQFNNVTGLSYSAGTFTLANSGIYIVNWMIAFQNGTVGTMRATYLKGFGYSSTRMGYQSQTVASSANMSLNSVLPWVLSSSTTFAIYGVCNGANCTTWSTASSSVSQCKLTVVRIA
jgi:hypothetical protein